MKTFLTLFALLLAISSSSAEAATLASTNFNGRTVTSGVTAGGLTWTLNGVSDPGDLTVVNEGDTDDSAMIFNNGSAGNTANANRLSIDRNLFNEGEWSVTTPVALSSSTGLLLQSVSFDWQNIANTGANQAAANTRPVRFTASVVGSTSGLLGSQAFETGGASSGAATVTFDTPVILDAAETYSVKLFAEEGSVGVTATGNNTGIDNWSLNGQVAPAGTSFIATTNFDGRSVTGTGNNVATNLNWAVNGVLDPGNLTVVNEGSVLNPASIFNNASNTNRLAVDRNLFNEGDWSISTPLVLDGDTASIDLYGVSFDWQNVSNTGADQPVGRAVSFTANLYDSSLTLLATKEFETGGPISGAAVIAFDSLIELLGGNSYTLELFVAEGTIGVMDGNNTSIDNFAILGSVTPVPEPSAILLAMMAGLGLVIVGVRRHRRRS